MSSWNSASEVKVDASERGVPIKTAKPNVRVENSNEVTALETWTQEGAGFCSGNIYMAILASFYYVLRSENDELAIFGGKRSSKTLQTSSM